MILIITEKKIGINSLSGEKKSGNNTGRGKFFSGKNLVTAKNLVTFPRLFFPQQGKLFTDPSRTQFRSIV